LDSEKPVERTIEPYFIEPTAAGHASYVIAYCHKACDLRTFKVERIEQADLTTESYEIPSSFDPNKYLSSAWGIISDNEGVTVRLKFMPQVTKILEETVYHPSQTIERLSDGSLLATFMVTDSIELTGWIMGWGEQVEVLEPEGLRYRVIDTSKAIMQVYIQNHPYTSE
jgi:predicted DNA-binding transcriptional regulator YafY